MSNKKLQKMLRLADIKPITESTEKNLSSVETLKKAANGKTYAIVRENRKYYIKVTDKTENLTESDFDYIGGVKNKPKYSYNSFSEASRNMNYVFEEVNRAHGGDMVNILESDNDLLGEKKYVLKQKSAPAPKPEPELDFGSDEKGGGDEFDFGSDEDGGFDFGDSEGGEEDLDFGGDDEDLDMDDEDFDDEDDPIKSIQQTTGELGQQLRDTEDKSSDLQKWVAKSVLAALDLDDMEKADKKDLIKTIKKGNEDEEEDDDFGGGDMDFGGEDMEENYDNYMDDEEMPLSDVDMPIQDKAYLNIDPDVLTSDDLYGASGEYDNYMDDEEDTEGMCTHCSGTGCSHCAGLGYHDVPMSDVDMSIQDKGYLNLEPGVASGMDVDYDSYMNDEEDYAKSYADKDIRSHYNKPSFDEMERGHALPYDTEFDCIHCDNAGCEECDGTLYPNQDMMDDIRFEDELDVARGGERFDTDDILYDSYMEEDDTESFATIEDELGLPPATPEVDETDYAHTEMMGESIDDVDSLMEFIDIDEELNDDEDMEMNNPAPAKEPKTKPAPTKPDTDRPARPSRRPFTPPPHIRPGEEPRPKADWDDDSDVEFE